MLSEILLFQALKWREVKVTQSCLTLCNPMDCSLPGSSVHDILQARVLEWVAVPFSRRSSQPRDQTQVFRIAGRFFTVWATREAQEYWCGRSGFQQANSLPFEMPEKPKNTGVGSLSLLQRIFLTQESGWGLLHCRPAELPGWWCFYAVCGALRAQKSIPFLPQKVALFLRVACTELPW